MQKFVSQFTNRKLYLSYIPFQKIQMQKKTSNIPLSFVEQKMRIYFITLLQL